MFVQIQITQGRRIDIHGSFVIYADYQSSHLNVEDGWFQEMSLPRRTTPAVAVAAHATTVVINLSNIMLLFERLNVSRFDILDSEANHLSYKVC